MKRWTMISGGIGVAALVCGGIVVALIHGTREPNIVPTSQVTSAVPSRQPSAGESGSAPASEPGQVVSPSESPTFSPIPTVSPIKEGQRPHITFPPQPKPVTH
ncbi:MAG: hypothetical protein LKJ57_03895 [Ancrocorticia sp.]|nr:hypothetical protein [Ancrocorticia sp.]MCI1896114.1 hypothetical protein [Ancrocorticia sp.]MCI2012731.1 hypothetical protein [Ancrocorticia sp.]MCI2029667.1 hypothetical protein [Ancrocorticia sp.]MCI2178442.1 hypothetical protein [Ancrocorticia sp.]